MDDSGRGEILLLSHRIPWPPDRGDKIRSHHELRALAALAPVHVGCFADDARDESFAPEMANLTASQCVVRRPGGRAKAALRGLARRAPLSVSLFESAQMRDWVRRVLAERPIRAVFAFSGQVAQYVGDLPPGCRFVMDFVDVDSAKFAAYGAAERGAMAWIHRREGRLLAAYERAVAARADVSLFVSDAEARLFRDGAALPPERVRALENGVDTAYFDPAKVSPIALNALPVTGPLIVFTGQMDYRPNIEAVLDFARHGFPAIRQADGTAQFAVVGRDPVAEVRALADLPGLIVTGAVPDVRPWLAAAQVVVVPLQLARGIQNKVLEAMAMGRAVVASAPAAEGIDAIDGRDLLVASGADALAALVLGLLADPARRAALGAAARARVQARYGWAAAMAPLEDMLFGDRQAGAAT
ncbi:TIGR03087 family PEP-CTERM/XrtA system glycosyltransferase [Sphingobium lignivorans]|uniref:Sugar transferase (PEP-CTERM/EpsH1 system associated) n=1 Tax=Sphingobium lignivorans TaxID=2735886 RepID=A0ABR6NGP9_9SPHN|nr:TIGR03087 family PEP-CTERM/XrtA system glycosyltransferase [Sphingobium lignivorans]MBB5986455.1 sugar transferase (PEP-CTERM/EpsH1 system associated) [Sphingobium lignivorans]